jgi:predicted nucleotide-binding protein (sugar kinase/HSP70/actin superfamily)
MVEGRRYAVPITRHFRRPEERPFTLAQRPHTTILVGGLSPQHDQLVEAAVRSMGYRCRALPAADLDAFTAGKEYGNNGLCNPAYFTVGNLVRHLQELEAEGMSREEIVDSHVFLTAGSCGTCRFGMYEAEYRLALGNAGFDGFRVLVMGTDDGIDQSGDEPMGLDLDMDFLLGLIQAFDLADTLNQQAWRLRAYEAEEGAVDEALATVMSDLYARMLRRDKYDLARHWTRIFLGTPLEGVARYVAKVGQLVRSEEFLEGMSAARERFDAIELDPFRVRPIVRITGEFWAQCCEGDGNFNVHRFLTREGAEVFVDRIIFTRLAYTLFIHRGWTRDRKGLRDGEGRIRHYLRYYRKQGILTLGEWLLRKKNNRLLDALGADFHEMVPQDEMARIADPYYAWRTTSGEAHLEVADNIYYHQHHLCHMVLSVKPFTCMPSTQSDGVQARVVEDFPGMIFLPIETAGEGEVIAHSRVQMALGTARAKARNEMADALARSGRTLPELRSWVEDHPELGRASYRVPRTEGVVGRAANLALHVASLMDRRPVRTFVSREV